MKELRPPITPFTPEDTARIQVELNRKLDKSDISYRPSAAGNVAYLEGWRSFNLANDTFGFNGWSSEILQLTTDFFETDAQGRISVGVTCMVRVTLKDGVFHDDVGFGSSDGVKSRGAAFEKAKKEAVTDGMKRALRVFGNRLGNCAYDKVFLRDVKNSQGTQNTQNTQNTQSDPSFVPTWQSAKSALSAASSVSMKPIAFNPSVKPEAKTDSLQSDDFDALLTEADLYDLEMQSAIN